MAPKRKDERKGESARNAVEGMLGALTSDMFSGNTELSHEEQIEILEKEKQELEIRISEFESGDVSIDGSELEDLYQQLQQYEKVLNTAIVPSSNGEFSFRNFRLTRVGIVTPNEINSSDWEALGEALGRAGDAWQFWIGDYANANKNAWGKSYDDTAELFGVEVETVTDFAYVCRTIQISLRNENLKFSHHKLAAGLVKRFGEDVAAKALKKAADDNMTVRDFALHLSAIRRRLTGGDKVERLFDVKPVVKTVKRLAKLFEMSDDARLTEEDRKSYQKDLEDLKRLISQLEDKLD